MKILQKVSKWGEAFRRPNSQVESLFATRAPKVAQREPKGSPGGPRDAQSDEKASKMVPRDAPNPLKTTKQTPKIAAPVPSKTQKKNTGASCCFDALSAS